jgi:hypothetical protein
VSLAWIIRALMLALTVLLAGPCFAQSPCQVKPGQHTVVIPLQNAPNSSEPACQPARIRVNDRAPVTLRLTGVSPIDVCLVSSKPQTVTPVTNPLEALINTISGLKSFDFEPATQFSAAAIDNIVLFQAVSPAQPPPGETEAEKRARLEAEKKAAEAKAADDEALKLFRALAKTLRPTAEPVFVKQTAWQGYYKADLVAIATYLAQDYRGTQYVNFRPESDPLLASVRSHQSFPTAAPADPASPPSEVDYAALQALVDELKPLQTRLVSSCTTAGQKCDAGALETTARLLDSANAVLLVAQDNLKILQTAQAAVVTGYTALDKVYQDYQTRIRLRTIVGVGNILVQDIPLGPDYGATDTGSITCTSDAAPTQATTDAINFTVLYQNVPALTVSVGLLTTFLEKTEIGTTPKLNSDGTFSTYFAVTDSARASVFPMAYVNYRVCPPVLKNWWGQPESELVITNSISGGIGVNPNTGTNQVEFFVGDAIGFNRVYIHLGAHFGRTESLGGGFQLNTVVPTGFSGPAPINWSYHPAFSIGFSVRIAPF